MSRRRRSALATALMIPAIAAFWACSESGPVTFQGYVEGEFVDVGAGIAGRLDRLFVERGHTVAANAPW